MPVYTIVERWYRSPSPAHSIWLIVNEAGVCINYAKSLEEAVSYLVWKFDWAPPQ